MPQARGQVKERGPQFMWNKKTNSIKKQAKSWIKIYRKLKREKLTEGGKWQNVCQCAD